jgi:tetratricopeptide (TPR) repeat protein
MTSGDRPGDPDDLVARARTLVELHRPDEAVRILGLALSQEPEHLAAWSWLAVAHDARGRPEEMLSAANRVVALAPDDETGHRLASIALAGLGQGREAVRAAAEAVRLDPTDYRTHLQYALVASAVPKLAPQALAAAHRARELNPHSANVAFALALASAAGGARDAEVAEHYRAALRLDPEHVNARINLTNLDRGTHLGRMAAGYAAVLRLDPGESIARGNLEVMGFRLLMRLAALAAFGVLADALVATGEHEAAWSPPRVVVGVLVLLLGAGYAAAVLRRVPTGAVVHLRSRLRHRGRVLYGSLVAGVVVAALLASSFTPVGGAVALLCTGPLAWVLGWTGLRLVRRRVERSVRRRHRRRLVRRASPRGPT